VDETYVKLAGRWVYLYRAVDQFGQVIDVYASTRRDIQAARRFFQYARTVTGVEPREVVTERAPPTRACWTSCGRRPGTTASSTPITGSGPTTPN
jgi:transposase-like protein